MVTGLDNWPVKEFFTQFLPYEADKKIKVCKEGALEAILAFEEYERNVARLNVSDPKLDAILKLNRMNVKRAIYNICPVMASFDFNTNGVQFNGDISKLLAFIIWDVMELGVKEYRLENIIKLYHGNTKGYDFLLRGSDGKWQKIEQKFSMNQGPGVSGNSHSASKESKYLQGKTYIEDNRITRLWVSFLDQADCCGQTGWSHVKKPKSKEQQEVSAWSTFKTHVEDAGKHYLIHGSMDPKIVWCHEVLERI